MHTDDGYANLDEVGDLAKQVGLVNPHAAALHRVSHEIYSGAGHEVMEQEQQVDPVHAVQHRVHNKVRQRHVAQKGLAWVMCDG